ncbi:MAG TPA: glycosyl hydrolase family 65 protein, partial [Treponemataceae bacterium]|nr:glycosyl hydrolase family 65 protein [Treponemataceae bacterium]
ILYDEKTKIYEQHEGFFDLPHLEINSISNKDFPLYHHWSYDRIYRTDMIKQPDVLMFMFLHSKDFSLDEILANYEYYEPRTIHESSLSPSIHSIFASQLQKHEEAFKFFSFATRMDLDNYNRNTGEGLHTTSIAAAWVNIVYGFGGMRSDGEVLSFSPSLPAQWKSYEFRIAYKESHIRVLISATSVEFTIIGNRIETEKIEIELYGKTCFIDSNGLCVSLPSGHRG